MQTDSVLLIELGRETLAVARSLGRAGFHVIVCNSGITSIIESSRYCHEVWRHPPIDSDVMLESALVMYLDSRPDIRFIFPIGERAPVAISSMRRILERDVILVMVHSPLLEKCLNKSQANEMAMGLDFNVPKFSEVQSLPEIQTFVDEVGFPIIVKPCRSSKKILGRKAYILSSQEELETLFSTWPLDHSSLIVQQYIQGDIEGCDFVASEGKLVGYFESESVRTDLPDGTGFAVELCSVPVSPDVFSACDNLVRNYNYSGAGLIQFIRCRRTSVLYFIEINPRLSAGISHVVACGQDFPLLTLKA
ncbi:MAG: putative ATP-grasp superfamily ATP-dependent carboligase, partial [Oleispira sp.]